MKAFFFVWAALVACSTEVVAPAPRVAAVEQAPPVAPIKGGADPKPWRILGGPHETLLAITDTSIEERDPATGEPSLAVPRGQGWPLAFVRSSKRIYVLFGLEGSHRLLELDDDLNTVADQTTPGDIPYRDSAYPALVEPGKKGVRISYRTSCDQPDGCVVYETHRISDLTVLATRNIAYRSPWDRKRPPPPVPRDQGDADFAPQPPLPELDTEHGTVTTVDGRTAPCEVHGTLFVDKVVVGHTLFVLTTGCCGGPHGGFFACNLP